MLNYFLFNLFLFLQKSGWAKAPPPPPPTATPSAQSLQFISEDEKHFLVSCPVYQEKRKFLFECLYKEFKIPIKEMSTENIFLLLLNPPSNDVDLQKLVAKHIHNCYEIRQKKTLANPQLTLENCKFVNLFGSMSMYDVQDTK